MQNRTHTKATANTRISLFINAVFRKWTGICVDDLSADISVASEDGLIGLIGGTGAGGFSKGRPSLLCSSRALTRKASALRGKTVVEKRLQLGAKKWGRTPLRAWSSRAQRRCRKQAGSCWRAHMESLNLTGKTQGEKMSAKWETEENWMNDWKW